MTDAEIAALVQDLGSDRWKVREKASATLRGAGRRRWRLACAADSGDAEIAMRAKTILADFDWEIFPDTPKHVVDAIAEYRVA